MSCHHIDPVKLAANTATAFNAVFELQAILQSPRFNFPVRTLRKKDVQDQTNNVYLIPTGYNWKRQLESISNLLPDFTEEVGSDTAGEAIADEWQDETVNLSNYDLVSPADILETRQTLIEYYEGFLNQFQPCEVEVPQGHVCIDSGVLADIAQGINEAINLLADANEWYSWQPEFGTDWTEGLVPTNVLTQSHAFTITRARYLELRAEKKKVRDAMGHASAAREIMNFTYDCSDAPGGQEDCEEILEAIENLKLECDFSDLYSFIHNLHIDLWAHIDEVRADIIEEIWKLNFPEQDYSDLEALINSKFPTLNGLTVGRKACGLGWENVWNYQGEGLLGLSNQIETLSQQVDLIQQNLCNYTDVKGNNIRDSLTNLINTSFYELRVWLSPQFDRIIAYVDQRVNQIIVKLDQMMVQLLARINELAGQLLERFNWLATHLEGFISNKFNEYFPNLFGTYVEGQCDGQPQNPAVWTFNNRGFWGLRDQLNALYSWLRREQEKDCNMGSSEPEQPSEEETPIECGVVLPAYDHENMVLKTQLQITWIESDVKKPGRKDSKWNLHIPNPKLNIDWCRDGFESIRWQKGNRFKVRLKWGDGWGSHTHLQFKTEGNADLVAQWLASLSTDAPLATEVIKGIKPKRPQKEVELKPYLAILTEFEEDGRTVRNATCYKRPPKGCE